MNFGYAYLPSKKVLTIEGYRCCFKMSCGRQCVGSVVFKEAPQMDYCFASDDFRGLKKILEPKLKKNIRMIRMDV